MAEQDAQSVIASLASYFSDPNNMRIPSIETLRRNADLSLNYDNPEPTIWPPEGSNAYNYNTIRVTVYVNFDCCRRGSNYIATGNAYINPELAAKETGIKRVSPVFFQGGYWEK